MDVIVEGLLPLGQCQFQAIIYALCLPCSLDRRRGLAYAGGDEGAEGEEMTETEWVACTDPQKMLGFLRGKTSARKSHLFGIA